MMSRFALQGSMAAISLGLALTWAAAAQPPQPPSPAQAALTSARQGQKYLFLLFWKEDSAATQAMKQTLDAALARRGLQAFSIAVNTTDPSERKVVAQLGVGRSPMPLLVAIAPNGAITGGFPLKVSEQEVNRAFVSPGTAACLKAAQARKLVLLCVQSAGVQEVPPGVRELKADAQYGPATEIVTVRADDPAEAGLLQALKIQSASSTVIAFLAPPGSLVGTFGHTASKQQLVEKLKNAQSCCCPGGCCSGGCCAGGKGNPKP